MKRLLSYLTLPILFVALSVMAVAAEPVQDNYLAMSKKPSAMKNPCGANPCAVNPCATKNPCAVNPCAAKNPCATNPCAVNPCAVNPCAVNPCAVNPCAPVNVCNPCAVNPPLRKKGIKSQKVAIKMGKRLWNDTKLGNSGLNCNSCHTGGMQLNLDKVGPFPHYVKMPNDVLTLDQMINYCMINPMKAKPLPWDSRELTAMAAYYQDIVKRYKKGALNPCAVNPCAAKNPCAVNPCAANPCAIKNPCQGKW